jgi:HEAT repeat protein
LEAQWAELASDEAVRGQRAVQLLAADPGRAIPFLRERLRPASAPNALRLAKLVSQLDSEEFAAREQATAEMTNLGEEAAPALRRALETAASPEVGRRIQAILKQLEQPSGQRWRQLRAIQMLEQVGNAEAQALLRTLTQGDGDAWLTQEAKASLERLTRRTAATP